MHLPRSIPGQAVRKAVADCQLLASDATIVELVDVLGRPKFDAYVTIRERQEFLRLFNRIADRIPITRVIQVCRDPKDDKFLELAVNGAAQLIITGDADLLAVHPSAASIFTLRYATSSLPRPRLPRSRPMP